MLICTKFTSHIDGFLLGFADLYSEKMDLEFKGCTLHQKNRARWVNFPCKEFFNTQKEKIFVPIVSFKNKKTMDAFSAEAKKSIDKWIMDNHEKNI